VKKLNVTPKQSDTSRAIQAEADQEYATLGDCAARSSTKAYAENEVKYHQEVNGPLQTTPIPSAQNLQLKALLEKGLKLFQGHQQMAEQLAAGPH
jgi:putative membrane protein